MSTLDLCKSFALDLFYRDKQASLLPISAAHAAFTPLTSVKQVHTLDPSRMKIFFTPWARNQTRSLSGDIYIQTVIHPDHFKETMAMGEWLVSNEYDARLSVSQSEEMRIIGVLLYSNQFINRDNLSKAIIDDPSWNPDDEDDYGIFNLSLRNFSLDNQTVVRILFVSTEVSKMEKMTQHFSSLYDGSSKKYPYCAPFLFVPLYKCTLSHEFRAQLIRMHVDRVGESLKAITIKGMHSLETTVGLKTSSGNPTYSTVKELLLGLPASQGMVTHFLFQNIEPQVNSDFYLAVYAAENEVILEERLKSLTKDILSLLAPGESAKFFIDPNRGFIFGRDIRQYVSNDSIVQRTMSPSSAIQLQRISQLVRSPSVKRSSNSASSTSRSTKTRSTDSTERATANMTTSFSSITQRNTTSFSSPTTSYSRSTSNTEVSITIERRFVSIQTSI